MRDMRKWMNGDFISAMDLMTEDGRGYKTLDLTIARVDDPKPVQCGPKKEVLAVLSFQKAKKRMILRNVHMKSLVKLFGPDADAMAGKRVQLWVEEDVKAFGDVMDCVRFKAAGRKPMRLDPPAKEPDKGSLLEEELAAPDEPPDESPTAPTVQDLADVLDVNEIEFDDLRKILNLGTAKTVEDVHPDRIPDAMAAALKIASAG